MHAAHYEGIVEALRAAPFGSCVNLKLLQKRFPGVRLQTLISIYSAENQLKVIKSNHLHKSRIQEYCARYLRGEDILNLCANVDFPPCMMLRRMLEQILLVNKQAIGDILKAPHLLKQSVRVEAASPELLSRLEQDIPRCVLADTTYSPLSDMAKQAAGLEHEMLLEELLAAEGIPFWTESDLRAHGYFKTPDVRLQVPIAVQDPQSGAFRLVSWIDSKATFGDERVHSRQLEEQYRTYVNRYGPGLVIYWCGYLEGLGNWDASVMVTDVFPHCSNIIRLPEAELPNEGS